LVNAALASGDAHLRALYRRQTFGDRLGELELAILDKHYRRNRD
jgi:hypothetical protein